MTEPILLNTQQAAKLLGMSERQVRELIYGGVIPVVRLDRRIRIPRAALERRIAEMTTYGQEPDRAVALVDKIRREVREVEARAKSRRSRHPGHDAAGAAGAHPARAPRLRHLP